MKTVEYKLPSHYASLLINDDASGLEENESIGIIEWMSDIRDNNDYDLFYCVDCKDDGFSPYNDLNNLGADCSIFTFQIS